MHELQMAGAVTYGWCRQKCDLAGSALDAVDLTDRDRVRRAFRKVRPDLIIHSAAVSNAARCVRCVEATWRVNAEGTAFLAELADTIGARIVFVSTDWVFDGNKGGYSEQDTPCPTTVYGETKLYGEKKVLACRTGVAVRFSLLFGRLRSGRITGFDRIVEAIKAGRSVSMCYDEWRTPLRYSHAAKGLIAVALSDFRGVIHMAGRDRISRLEMGRKVAELLGADLSLCRPISRHDVAKNYHRPADTSLTTNLSRRLFPDLVDHGIDQQLAEELQQPCVS